MVMHARKLPRVNDGYFDRNHSHQYQNSVKYAKGGYGEKMRNSPSNGSTYRSESPDDSRSHSRDRSYHNKASYSQRLKDRTREKFDNESTRSPKDKSKSIPNRDHHPSHRNFDGIGNDHRSNHDRISNVEEKEKRLQVGDWSEHTSSSGKRYYYNCKTEVSQWEKPKDWIDWEKRHLVSGCDSNKAKDNSHEKGSVDKHSSERTSRLSAHHHHHHHHHSGSNLEDRHLKSIASSSSSTNRGHSSQLNDHIHRNSHSSGKDEQSRHSEWTNSRSRLSNSKRDDDRKYKCQKNNDDSQVLDMETSSDGTPQDSQCESNSQSQTPISFPTMPNNSSVQLSATTVGGTSLANLPKLLSQLTGTKGMSNHEKSELSAHEALQTLQTALLITRQVTLAQSGHTITGQSPHSSCAPSDSSPFPTQRSPVPASTQVLVTNNVAETKSKNEEERERGRCSPSSEYSHRSSSKRDSPTSSVSSLQGITSQVTTSLASAALRPAIPTISPYLSNYFREDLINHVLGWQADHAERQANKYSEEAYSLGSLSCTKVSADLKITRSFVRASEIQATLQEQRILFLRQQIKELEDWKSQNSFMSDT